MSVLNATEQRAMDHILIAMNIIDREWKLRANEAELTMHVHGLQSFVIQHMLERTAPTHWGQWYEVVT